MVPDDPASTPSDAETSQMPAVPPARSEPDQVVWPEDPWVADGRAAEDPTLEGGAPMVTTPVIPTWPESRAGEPSVPSHSAVNPTANDPETAPFPTQKPGQASDPAVMKTAPPQPAASPEPVEDVHDTVPPTPTADAAAPAEATEVETADAALETVPPEVDAGEASEEESASPPAAEAVVDEATPAAAAEEEAPAAIETAEPEVEPEAEAAPEPAPEAEPVTEPEPATEPEPVMEPVQAEEPEPPAPVEPPVEPATPAAGTPAWAAQAVTPATPAPASPFAPSGPAIPSWAPNAPTAPAKPQPDAPTQWPGINVPAWAPQPTVSHPGTANPLPGSASPYVEPVRPSQPAPPPAPVRASAPAPAAPAPAPAPTTASTPATPKTSSWEVVEQKRAAEPQHQGPTPEDKSYAEWFAWAKRSGAPAGACHAAAQGAFRALAAGHDMNTAVQWATLAMASPPGLVGQSRQLYCAWYSLGNIDLKLPTAQAHAFANGAIQALEEGADSMGAHQAGLLAAGITGG